MKRRGLFRFVGIGLAATLGGCLSASSSSGPSDGDEPYPDRRLRVVSSVNDDLDVTARLNDLDDDRTVHERTYEVSFGEEVKLDDALEPGDEYRFVLEIDGEAAFETTIYAYEGYELGVLATDEVEVRSHVEHD